VVQLKIFAFTGKESNFGDDLNHWMWPQVLPDFFDEDDSVRFIGIGSTLYDSHPATSRKVVFGAGYAGYSPLPTIDDSWDFRFVRGKNTARILGLSEDLAVGDAAILLRTLNIPPREKRYDISYMPHFESAIQGSWEAVCRKAGVHLIDPRWPVERVLDDMLASRLLVSEAMHGVIVADALRVPWRAIEPLDPNHRAKWQDWASVLDLNISFTKLGPSNGIEWLMTHFWKKRRVIYALRKRRAKLVALGGAIASPFAVRALRAMKGSQGQLSPDAAIERATERMRIEVQRLKESYA
jgi:hypothetical protein